MVDLNVSQVVATLGTSLFVISYTTGPILWSPLSEALKFGRSPVYIASLAIFVLLQLPIALVTLQRQS